MVLVERSKIVRSLSSPQLPSPPTTGASSRTIFNTARNSEASSPSSLVKYDQILDNRGDLSKKCLEAQYEYIKGEEEERNNADWVALLKWMDAGHQAEVIKLQKEHTAEIEDLKQQRSEVRRRLEVRNRELRATRREVKELKETLEDLTKDQEEVRPASDPQSLTESHEESPDEEEGGVVLANKNIASAEEAEILEHCESNPIKNKGKGKEPAWETAEERRERQRVQKQQLLDDSTPDFAGPSTGANAVQPAVFGQVQASTATCAKTGSNANNGGLSTEVQDLQAHNRGLKASLAFTREVIAQLSSEAEAGKEEMARLRAGNHFAQLEVGHCHAANACYRAALEDENPARTAHLDGLLKQKDAAYAELETRAAECARLLWEEKKESAIDNIYNLGKMQGLEKELAHRLNMIQALTEGRDLLKQQNDEIIRMFEAKIYPDDATKALLADYDTIRKDNTILAKVVQERDCYVLDAEKQVCDLKAEAVVQELAMDRERLTHRQTEQSLNGLTVINHQLTARLEIAEQTRGEEQEAFQAQLQAKSDEVNHISTQGANPVLMQRLEAQHAHIAALNHEIAQLNAMGNQWRMRALEQQDEWCPMWQFGEINDWDAEEMRGRLWGAEQQVRVLRGVVGRLRREGVEVGGMEIGHDGSRWLVDRAEAEGVREAFE